MTRNLIRNPSAEGAARLLAPLLAVALWASGCAVQTQEEADTDAVEPGPDELVIGGRRFVRPWMLSDWDVQEMSDPALWEPPETVDKLAQLLRSHMLHTELGAFVEAEPNYERARRSLGLDPPGDLVGGDEPLDPSVAEAAKSVTITANGDNRVLAFNNPFTNESLAYAFYETGGTGTMVGWRIYTAGHVLFNNPWMMGTDGFICRDGLGDNTPPICGGPGIPRWRWGGRIVGGTPTFTTGWTLCGFKAVPNGFSSLPAGSSNFTFARWDYGLQNLDGCIPGSGVGNVDWWLAGQTALRTRNLWQAGYPGLFTCPALRAGGSQTSGDCPASGSQGVVQTLPGFTTRPYTGANLFWASSTGTGADNSLIVTGGYIRSSLIDITTGQSGGAVITFEQDAWRAVGTVSNTNNGAAETRFNHLTTEVKDFLYQ